MRGGPYAFARTTRTNEVLLALFGLADLFHGFFGGPDRVGDHPEIGERGRIPVVFGKLRGGGGILDNGHFEALLQKLAEMGLHTQIRRHACQDDLVDPALAELKDQIILAGSCRIC